MKKLYILKEFWDFIRARKKWWLIPVTVLLFALSILIFLGQGSVAAPFIYTIF